MASLLVVGVLLLVAATPARVNGELPLAAETDSLLQAASHGAAPTAEPLTKSKTVRCFKQNVLRDDGRNYEVEHIRKDEDVVESVQRSGRDLRLSADAAVPPGCVVVTSVRQDEGEGGGGGGGGGGGQHHDMTLAHFPEYPQYGGGGGGGGLHVGDVVLPQLPYPVQGVSLSGGVGGGGFEYGGGGGAGGGGGQISDVLLPRPGGGYGYGSGGGVDNFINFKDVSGGSSGSPPHQHGGAGGADAVGGGGGNGGEAEVLRTYQVSTNLRRQESFDHHAFGVEKGVKPTGGFHFAFGGGGNGNSNGLGAGTKYETSANDLDQVVSSGAPAATSAAATLLACALARLLAL
ncbi:WAG22 antigen-like [Schistocerca gregaria]|uniref:WAG22 antigen-like n=1 Tax=Schistocerca gregaria TaxID=7010 RepID=UPI00211EE26D|nr:WAG22 antigen-like [Schistocerca gregaria]